MDRRTFLTLTTTTAAMACADCLAMADGDGLEQLVDAGPVAGFASDGAYAAFRDLGFFVIRKNGKLTAISSFCTHRKCKVKAQPDRSFYCKCHGATFAPDGHVTQGPARRDLPVLVTSVNANGHFLVRVPPR